LGSKPTHPTSTAEAGDPQPAGWRRALGGLRVPTSGMDALSYVDFRWVWTGAFVAFLAMNMQWVARGWLVLHLSDNSPLALAMVMASFALPMTVISIVGGALSDRIPRKYLLVYVQVVNAVVTLGVAVLDMTGAIQYWHILVSGLMNGTLMAFNMPSRQAIISDILPDGKLMSGIALVSSGMNATRIVGPALAGFLILIIGTHGVFVLIALAYLVSGLSMAKLKTGDHYKPRSGKSMKGDILAGLSYAAKEPTLLSLLVMAFIPVLFGMSYNALLPAWAKEALNIEPDGLGLLFMVMGIGALAGSLALANMGGFRRCGAVLLASCVAWGVALALFSQSTSFIIALPLLLVIGFMSSVYMALNSTLIQLYAAPEMRGRVTSISMMSFGALPLSAVPFGALAEGIGTPNALTLSGILLLCFTIAFALLRPAFRRIA